MLALLAEVALAEAPAEVRYHNNARVALWGGIASAAVPPVATGIVIALRMQRLERPPSTLEICREGPVGAIICVLLFPVLIAIDMVMFEVWLIDVVARSAIETAPLYPVLPALLLRTSYQGRRALLDVGLDVPGTWGALGTVALGLHVGALAGAFIAAEVDSEDAFTPLAAASFVGWAGSVGCGLAQWSVDRRHAHLAGVAGPDWNANAREIPLIVVSGQW